MKQHDEAQCYELTPRTVTSLIAGSTIPTTASSADGVIKGNILSRVEAVRQQQGGSVGESCPWSAAWPD